MIMTKRANHHRLFVYCRVFNNNKNTIIICLFFHMIVYTLTPFWQRTQMSNTNLNNPFQLNIKFDELLREIDLLQKVLQKVEFK